MSNDIKNHVYPIYVKDMVKLNLQEKIAGRVLGWENGICPIDATLSFWVGWLDAKRDAGHINATQAQIKHIHSRLAYIGCLAPWVRDYELSPSYMQEVMLRQKVIHPNMLKKSRRK